MYIQRHSFYYNFLVILSITTNPANIYLFKIINRNTKKWREMYLKLTIKTLECRHWHNSGVFTVNFEHISQNVFIVDFKQVPAKIYLLKVNNKNTRKRVWNMFKVSKLTIKTPERRHWRSSGVFIVNFAHISQLFIVFLLLTLNKLMLAK